MATAKQSRNRYPLKVIVGHARGRPDHGEFETLWYEVLECGHRQTPRVDAFGETNAIRRRCRKCWGMQNG